MYLLEPIVCNLRQAVKTATDDHEHGHEHNVIIPLPAPEGVTL